MGRILDVQNIDGLVIDMDGVLWRGSTALPGLTQLFAALRSRATPFVLATNNASHTPEHFVGRLARLGVTVYENEILTSSLAAADYLGREHPAGTPVFLVGGDGLRTAMLEARFDVVSRTQTAAAIVVVGIDFQLTYDKLADAAVHLQRGARFVATNADASFPAEAGLLPGAGAIVAALVTCTGLRPQVIGKPNAAMYEMAAAKLGLPMQRIAMVGDRLDTDILGANRVGMRSILVTTGVDDQAAVESSEIRPDAVFDGLEAIAAAWRAQEPSGI